MDASLQGYLHAAADTGLSHLEVYLTLISSFHRISDMFLLSDLVFASENSLNIAIA